MAPLGWHCGIPSGHAADRLRAVLDIARHAVLYSLIVIAAYRYTCAQCGAVFDAPGSDAYGILVTRSTGTGWAALVDASSDDVFNEVADRARSTISDGHFNDRQIGAAIQYAFGFACDPAPDGTRFSMSEQPHCPVCGSNRMVQWEATGRAVTDTLPGVTHAQWLTLGTDERQRIVRRAVHDFLSI